MRTIGPCDADGVSVWYRMVNGGKTVVEIDLKSDAGKGDFRALVERSDALLESYRPGVLDRLGFGHEALHAMNPRHRLLLALGLGARGTLPPARRPRHQLHGADRRAGALGRARAAGRLLPPHRRFRVRDAGRAQHHGRADRPQPGDKRPRRHHRREHRRDRAALAGLGAERALPRGMERAPCRAVSQWRRRLLQHLRDRRRPLRHPRRARRQVLGQLLHRLRPARVDRAPVGAPGRRARSSARSPRSSARAPSTR